MRLSLVLLPLLAPQILAAPAAAKLYRVLRKDAIPAIRDPQFVSAAASGLQAEEAVLGYSVGDDAHVYSLDLLNHHEIVNDVVGGRPVAATW